MRPLPLQREFYVICSAVPWVEIRWYCTMFHCCRVFASVRIPWATGSGGINEYDRHIDIYKLLVVWMIRFIISPCTVQIKFIRLHFKHTRMCKSTHWNQHWRCSEHLLLDDRSRILPSSFLNLSNLISPLKHWIFPFALYFFLEFIPFPLSLRYKSGLHLN